jgi:predicted phage-related endonuclease
MPALFDASPYLTRWMLWQKFASGVEPERAASERMDWGTKMQPIIIEQVAKERGLEVIPNPDLYVRRGLLGCTRDATIISPGVGPGALEIKCVFDYKIWMQKWDGGKHVPREIEMQLQQQMYVADGEEMSAGGPISHYNWGLIVVWVCADLYYFERKPVFELWDFMSERAIEFFADVAEAREPDPFGSAIEMPLLAKLYPTDPGKVLDLSDDPAHIKTSENVSMFAHLKSEATGAAASADKIKAELFALAKDAELVKLPCGVNYKIKKSGKGRTIDPYIPENPTAPPAPRGESILAGG